MGTWYLYYLEKRMGNEKWTPLKYNDDDCIYSVRSFCRSFYDKYGTMFPIGIVIL